MNRLFNICRFLLVILGAISILPALFVLISPHFFHEMDIRVTTTLISAALPLALSEIILGLTSRTFHLNESKGFLAISLVLLPLFLIKPVLTAISIINPPFVAYKVAYPLFTLLHLTLCAIFLTSHLKHCLKKKPSPK